MYKRQAQYIVYAKEKGCSMQGTEDPAVEYLKAVSYTHLGENLFIDDWMDFSFPDVDKVIYGKHAKNVMKTDVKETDNSYEVDMQSSGNPYGGDDGYAVHRFCARQAAG